MFVYYILRPTSERTTSISPSFNHTWSIGGTGEKVFKVWQSWYVQMKCCWWGTWMNVVVWKTLGACLMEKKQISVSLMARIIGSLWIALLPSCPCYCQVWRWWVDPGFPIRDSGSDHYLNTESSICSTLQIWQKQLCTSTHRFCASGPRSEQLLGPGVYLAGQHEHGPAELLCCLRPWRGIQRCIPPQYQHDSTETEERLYSAVQ